MADCGAGAAGRPGAADRRADGVRRERPGTAGFVAALREALRELGWAEGRGIRIDTRWATPDDAEVDTALSQELVALEPDLILAHNTPTTAALLQQTRTIPIIFATVTDPVGSGFVASVPRPGGNVTGFIPFEGSMSSKWLELLKEIAPRVVRVAFLHNPAAAPYAEYFLSPFKTAAASLGVEAPPHLFATGPSSNPSLPHRLASRIAALS